MVQHVKMINVIPKDKITNCVFSLIIVSMNPWVRSFIGLASSKLLGVVTVTFMSSPTVQVMFSPMVSQISCGSVEP